MSDWNQRTLCPDGGCVGLIGPDGTCKVCGRVAPNWGDERNRGLVDPDDSEDESEDDPEEYEDDDSEEYEDDDEDEDDDDDDAEDEGDDDGRHTVAAGPVEWTERTLCPDGGCIGVIGGDGKCKVCGRSAA